jgi:hypothetical protein
LFYERELFGGEDLKLILSRMILHLESGLMFMRRTMDSLEVSTDSASEVTDNDTDSDGKEHID